jgi:hypothetical protein
MGREKGEPRRLAQRSFTHPCPRDYHPQSITEGGVRMTATIEGRPRAIQPGERLIDLINRCGIEIPQVCYHPQLRPIQTCDTCMAEVDGKLVRACGTMAAEGTNVATSSPRASASVTAAEERALRVSSRSDPDGLRVPGALHANDGAFIAARFCRLRFPTPSTASRGGLSAGQSFSRFAPNPEAGCGRF